MSLHELQIVNELTPCQNDSIFAIVLNLKIDSFCY